LPHFRGLHPHGEPVDVQVLALLEELEPALLLGRDLFVGELVQFQEINPAVVEQTLAALVAQAALRKWISRLRFSSDPRRALKTQSILGSMGRRMGGV